jgi:hypothetical protein
LNVCVAPSSRASVELRVGEIDRDQRACVLIPRAEHRREPDAAETDHGCRAFDRHLRRVDDRAGAGDDRAAEHRGFVESQ